MLNTMIGSADIIDGKSVIVTRRGGKGHAVYGPYDLIQPGFYAVEFAIGLAGPGDLPASSRCAVLEVVVDVGQTILARRYIQFGQLSEADSRFSVNFAINQTSRVEYRVWVSGEASLRIAEYCKVVPLDSLGADAASLLSAGGFPDDAPEAPAFFRENLAQFRAMYERGMGVALAGDRTVLSVGGVNLHADRQDDLTFIGEVFYEKAYNIRCSGPLCVIDVGMNIGLTSLMLAAKPEVAAVHSYEPFPETYRRAIDNVMLNPALAEKIRPFNVGLSDERRDGERLVSATGDSGSNSIIEIATGTPVALAIRDAGEELAPIFDEAAAKGWKVAVKLDCEGSEFAIMRSLSRSGLLGRVSVFMVEWHAMFGDMNQDDLIRPLIEHGFVVFDRSPDRGNGFFYAVRG